MASRGGTVDGAGRSWDEGGSQALLSVGIGGISKYITAPSSYFSQLIWSPSDLVLFTGIEYVWLFLGLLLAQQDRLRSFRLRCCVCELCNSNDLQKWDI